MCRMWKAGRRMAKIDLTRSVEAGIPPHKRRHMQVVLRRLRRRRSRPILAIDFARDLKIDVFATADSRKRPVRRAVRTLRNVEGKQICADCHPTKGGYWLARNDTEWRRYRERRARNARFEFVSIRKMRDASSERNSGQKTLYENAECEMANQYRDSDGAGETRRTDDG